MSTVHSRTARIAAQLQRSLCALLQRSVKDPRVGNVTVTAIDLAPDLSVARVMVLPFASPAATGKAETADAMLEGLRSAAGFLRGQLARELSLRHAPRLQFELDRHLVQAHHLTELIDRVVEADQASVQESRREPPPDRNGGG